MVTLSARPAAPTTKWRWTPTSSIKPHRLRRFEYSLDAGPWTPVEAADGVTDSPREQYHIAIDALRPGEHLLVVRAYDTANNAGLAKVVIHVILAIGVLATMATSCPSIKRLFLPSFRR